MKLKIAVVAGLIAGMALATTSAAFAQNGGSALARQVVAASGEAAQVHKVMQTLSDQVTTQFATLVNNSTLTDADRTGLKALLSNAVRDEEPAFVTALAEAYDQTYSQQELQQLVSFYGASVPAGAHGPMPAPLAAKTEALRKAKADKARSLGMDMAAHVFDDYCKQLTCTDEVAKMFAAMADSARGGKLALPASPGADLVLVRPTPAELAEAYPTVAAMSGVNGHATLSCQARQGALDNCRVTEESPAGLGFGAAALNLVPHFKVKPVLADGKSSDGRTFSLPIAFNTAARASVAVTGPQPYLQSDTPTTVPDLHLTAVAPAGRKVRVWGAQMLKPDCTASGTMDTQVLQAPAHGEATITDGAFAGMTWPAGNPRAVCSAVEAPGKQAFYVAKADFHGRDELVMLNKTSEGRVRRIVVDIDVP